MFSNLMAGSWKTTVLGILQSVIIVAIEEVRNGGGLPTDIYGWLLYAAAILKGVAGAVQKDANKTHAPDPVPVPNTLSVTTGEIK